MNQLKSDFPAISSKPSRKKWSWEIEEEKRAKEEQEAMEKWCCICNDNGNVRFVAFSVTKISKFIFSDASIVIWTFTVIAASVSNMGVITLTIIKRKKFNTKFKMRDLLHSNLSYACKVRQKWSPYFL